MQRSSPFLPNASGGQVEQFLFRGGCPAGIIVIVVSKQQIHSQNVVLNNKMILM